MNEIDCSLYCLILLFLVVRIDAHQNTPPIGAPQNVQPHHQAHAQQAQRQQRMQPQPPGAHKFGDQHEVGDAEHIKSHLKDEINIDEKSMTPEQLQFHYFKMHDSNNDNKLDGIELIKAITHFHEDDNNADGDDQKPPQISEAEIEDMIDGILKDDDFNNDGLIDYSEFLKAQQQRT